MISYEKSWNAVFFLRNSSEEADNLKGIDSVGKYHFVDPEKDFAHDSFTQKFSLRYLE
jgi:hypothetical protein